MMMIWSISGVPRTIQTMICECAQRCNAAHRAEADKQAERQSEYQRQAEKLYGGNKAAHQAECYIGKHVVSSLPLFYFDT